MAKEVWNPEVLHIKQAMDRYQFVGIAHFRFVRRSGLPYTGVKLTIGDSPTVYRCRIEIAKDCNTSYAYTKDGRLLPLFMVPLGLLETPTTRSKGGLV